MLVVVWWWWWWWGGESHLSLTNSLQHIPALCWVLFLDEGGIADLNTEIKFTRCCMNQHDGAGGTKQQTLAESGEEQLL